VVATIPFYRSSKLIDIDVRTKGLFKKRLVVFGLFQVESRQPFMAEWCEAGVETREIDANNPQEVQATLNLLSQRHGKSND
jgi:hypothetical protein